jgi:dTDP-4-dehydrorhamnose 3,5-epimerase
MEVKGATIADVVTSKQGSQAATLSIPGLVLIAPRVFGDARGFFLETYQQARYAEFGIEAHFDQDNLSFSARGVLRGLHFQSPQAQAKLVSVVAGEVFDVAVDIRRGSPTFGLWAGVHLSGENRWQFYIPKGFAHGFCVLSETAYFSYKCAGYYAPADERTLHWSDPDLGIEWPLRTPTLSDKDATGMRLRDFPPEHLARFVA